MKFLLMFNDQFMFIFIHSFTLLCLSVEPKPLKTQKAAHHRPQTDFMTQTQKPQITGNEENEPKKPHITGNEEN